MPRRGPLEPKSPFCRSITYKIYLLDKLSRGNLSHIGFESCLLA